MGAVGREAVRVARGDDRLLAPTRVTATLIVPVLVAAWSVLFLFPARSDDLWAWAVAPEMTALVMGGGYLAGAYFFARVTRARRWHRVGWGFVGTTVFTTLLLLATVVHWDRFNHDHVSFWAWLALYVITPPLLPVLFVRNRRFDPGVPEPGDVPVPRPMRVAWVVAGAAQVALAVVMTAAPRLVLDRWPWTITPLTARTLAAFIAFPAVTWLCLAVDDRWSSFEVPFRTATLGLLLVAAAAVLARDDLDGPAWSVRVFAVVLAGTLAALLVVQVAMQRRAMPVRKRPRGSAAAA